MESPYRDERLGMAARCARLEAEVHMLRRTIRELSAKNTIPRRRSKRRASGLAKAFAWILTLVLTCAGWAVSKRSWGCNQPAKSGLQHAILAFSGDG